MTVQLEKELVKEVAHVVLGFVVSVSIYYINYLLLIHEADPQSRTVVIAIFKTSVHTFHNPAKQKTYLTGLSAVRVDH